MSPHYLVKRRTSLHVQSYLIFRQNQKTLAKTGSSVVHVETCISDSQCQGAVKGYYRLRRHALPVFLPLVYFDAARAFSQCLYEEPMRLARMLRT